MTRHRVATKPLSQNLETPVSHDSGPNGPNDPRMMLLLTGVIATFTVIIAVGTVVLVVLALLV